MISSAMACVVCVACSSAVAEAAAPSTWEVRLDLERGESSGEFSIPAARLAYHVLEGEARDATLEDDSQWARHAPALERYLGDHLSVRSGEQTCTPAAPGELERVSREESLWLVWRVLYRCSPPMREVRIINTSLTRSRFGFHHLGIIHVGDETHRTVFDVTAPIFTLSPRELSSGPTAHAPLTAPSNTHDDTLYTIVTALAALVVIVTLGCVLWLRPR